MEHIRDSLGALIIPSDGERPPKEWTPSPDPDEACATCKGREWVVPYGGSFQGRGLDPCPDCYGQDKYANLRRWIALQYSDAGFHRREAKSLDTLDPMMQGKPKARKQITEARSTAQRWASAQDVDTVIITGPVGTGKTHLLEGALRVVIEKRRECCRYTIWEDFAHHVRDWDRANAYMSELRDAPYLILDDVTSGHDPNDYLRTMLWELLGHRFHFAKPTLIAGNLEPEDAESPSDYWRRVFGDRMGSRVGDETRCRVASLWLCDDVRPKLGAR